MKITRAVVPSLFTVLNIFCGFRSIVHSSQGDFVLAAWFIILGGVFDTFDGIMARITRSSSDFGVEFDSLSDVVSFGAAPAFMVYQVWLHQLQGIGMLLSSMPMIFGALRLARFNTQLVGYDKDFFRGLPIPASAITLASFILTTIGSDGTLHGINGMLLVPMVIILSLLMVSTIKYDTVPKFSRRGFVAHPLRFTIAVIGMTAIVLTGGSAIFPFFVFYVATGPLRYMVKVIRQALHPVEKAEEENNAEVTSVDV
jgi:CDP-diacylglycerol---serine O-phosphatidyltransferase